MVYLFPPIFNKHQKQQTLARRARSGRISNGIYAQMRPIPQTEKHTAVTGSKRRTFHLVRLRIYIHTPGLPRPPRDSILTIVADPAFPEKGAGRLHAGIRSVHPSYNQGLWLGAAGDSPQVGHAVCGRGGKALGSVDRGPPRNVRRHSGDC